MKSRRTQTLCMIDECQQTADISFGQDSVCLDHYYEYEEWATILGVKQLFLRVLKNRGWTPAAEMVEQAKQLWLASLDNTGSKEEHPGAKRGFVRLMVKSQK